jgi:hypothetical protein
MINNSVRDRNLDIRVEHEAAGTLGNTIALIRGDFGDMRGKDARHFEKQPGVAVGHCGFGAREPDGVTFLGRNMDIEQQALAVASRYLAKRGGYAVGITISLARALVFANVALSIGTFAT